jgi:DNA repair exonuclease SbcCD ATPase subunit
MFIKFKVIRFKNFSSYSNKLTEFYFTQGMNYVSGLNGSGKSSLITDTISFVLFGKPFRKIKIAQLINRKNKSDLYTDIEFNIDNIEYKIVRTLNPTSIKIYKNGIELESLSSKVLIQDEINKLIGIDYLMFKQIIALAINHNKPFLDMGIPEKREIVESIFNIKIFGEMSKILKKECSTLNIQNDFNNKTLVILESNLKSLRKQLKDILQTKNDFETNKNKDIENINNKLIDNDKEILRINKTVEENKGEKERGDILLKEKDRLNNELLEIKKDIQVEKYKSSDIKKKMEVLLNNTICPVCDTTLTEEHKQREIDSLNNKENVTKNELIVLHSKEKDINLNLKNIQEQIDKINVILNNIKSEKTKLEFINNDILDLNFRLKNAQERIFNFDLDSLNVDFDKKKVEYSDLYSKNELLTLECKNNEIVSEILSDSGIKAYFFDKLIPILNNKINEYLQYFNLPVTFSFNTMLEENIIDVTNSYGESVPYHCFSSGEKKKIDIAILLAFIEMTKFVCNWNTNLLIFDEVLDSSLDQVAQSELFACIKNIATISPIQLCLYVISHKTTDEELFDNIIQIKKSNGFSNIEYIKH